MTQSAIPGRFGVAASPLPDRREQRKLDQAAGLVPFAVKLHADLAQRLRELAVQEGVSIHELTERLIESGLTASGSVAGAPKAAVAVKKVPAKKAPAKKAAAKKAVAKKAPTQAIKAAKQAVR